MRSLVALMLIGAPALLWADDMTAEKAKLQGVWVAVGLIDSGKTDERVKEGRLKLIFKEDKYIYQVDTTTFMATFKLDVTTKPKSMDVTFEEGPLKGKTMPAIYLLEGDELKICGGGERPAEFVSAQGTGTVLFTYKREKP